MKSFRRSKKALSPVVASIILIAVTVAVSIAVAAWMGALTVGFMGTEQLTITSATITSGSGNGNVTLYVSNTGTTSVTINQVWVGTSQISSPSIAYVLTSGATLDSNKQGTVTVGNQTFVSAGNYQFKLVSAKGTAFQYTAIAP